MQSWPWTTGAIHLANNESAGNWNTSIELMPMSRAKKTCWIGRSAWAIVAIALVLILSIAITLGAGHSFDQIALALPVFFVLLFLATSIGDWLDLADLVFEPQLRLSPSFTRGPPA